MTDDDGWQLMMNDDWLKIHDDWSGMSYQNLICGVRSEHGGSSLKSPQQNNNCDSLTVLCQLGWANLELVSETYQLGVYTYKDDWTTEHQVRLLHERQ